MHTKKRYFDSGELKNSTTYILILLIKGTNKKNQILTNEWAKGCPIILGRLAALNYQTSKEYETVLLMNLSYISIICQNLVFHDDALELSDK